MSVNKQVVSTRVDEAEEPSSLSFWQVLGSTFAAVIGVQSNANKVRDFTHGKFIHFAISGVLFAALFVGLMLLIVRLVLSMNPS